MRTYYHPDKDNLSQNYSSQYPPIKHSILGKKHKHRQKGPKY